MQFTKFRSRIAMEQWKIFGITYTRDLKKGNACSNHIDNLLDAITSKVIYNSKGYWNIAK